MKIMHGNCGLINEYERDLRSSEHYLSGSENKAWKVQAIRDLNPWTLEYHCSANELTELMGFSYIHFTGLLRTDIMTSSHFLMSNSYKWLSCIHSHLFITSRVYYEAKIMSGLASFVGIALHCSRRGHGFKSFPGLAKIVETYCIV